MTAPPLAPIRTGGLRLSVAEVKQLWWFSDGAIMNPPTRERLRAAWGLCPRHTWAAARVEHELRYQMLGTAVLYDDLAQRAAAATRPGIGGRIHARRLAARAGCLSCDYLRLGGAGDPGFAEHQRQVNESGRFATLLRRDISAAPEGLEALACPHCLPGGRGLPCRLHLVGGAAQVPDLADRLTALAGGLRAVAESMTWHGTPASATDRASWVQILGWFGTWDVPARLLSQQ